MFPGAAIGKSKLGEIGEGLVGQVLSVGIDGVGIGGVARFTSAREVAEEHLATYGDAELAIQELIATHTRLAAASGFVTGLGGVATLPVSIPAALAGLHILVTKAGEKGVINLSKLVPLVGALVGAAVDAVGCRTIATYALKTFEPIPGRAGMTVSPSAVVLDGEVVDDGTGEGTA